MDFRKVIYENVEKNIHFITNMSIYTVTDILKFFEDILHILKVCFVFKKQLLC